MIGAMDASARTDLARRVYAAARLTGSFTLRSGVVSDTYFDKYRFEAEPALLAATVEGLADHVPKGTDVLAGLELGGIPIVTMLSQRTGLPARFVRKAAKEYGTMQAVEGGDVDGRRVLVVEDVVTSGGAILDAVPELRRLGAQVSDVVCVIDRRGDGEDRLAGAGLSLHALFTMDELTAAAEGVA